MQFNKKRNPNGINSTETRLLSSTLPLSLRKVAEIFHSHQHQCWVVGGAIRDSLLNKVVEDYDLATEAPPHEVMKMFPRCLPTGIQHGTVTILFQGWHFRTTTFRRDGKYSDGRHPNEVRYSESILDDLSRRDFSMNAMAYNPISGAFMDPHGGRRDMEHRLIRAIGVPEERFREDCLRTIRACRFASQLGFTLEEETRKAVSTALPVIKGLAAERIWQELTKILASRKPSTALRLFLDTGLLKETLPEVENCRHVSCRGKRLIDILFQSCDALPRNMKRLRLAALLQNLTGMPHPLENKSGEQDRLNSQMAEKVLRRLKAPNADCLYIAGIVRSLSLEPAGDWSEGNVRRFLSRQGRESAGDLLKLLLAIAESVGDKDRTVQLRSLEKKTLEQASAPVKLDDLAINGRNLMHTFNLKPGRAIGNLLRQLLEYILDNPESNQKVTLLNRARELIEHEGGEL